MQTARRLVKGPDTAETSKRHLAKIKYPDFQAMTYSPAKMALCPH